MQANKLQDFKQVSCIRAACGRTVIDGRYYLVPGLIGIGSYSKVREAEDQAQKRRVAVKICGIGYLRKQTEAFRDETGELKYRSGLDKVLSEIHIMGLLKNQPGCCELVEVLWDSFEDRLYIIMHLADLGEALRWDHEIKAFFVRSKQVTNKLPEESGFNSNHKLTKVQKEDDDEDDYEEKQIEDHHKSAEKALQKRKFLSEASVRWIIKQLLSILTNRRTFLIQYMPCVSFTETLNHRI